MWWPVLNWTPVWVFLAVLACIAVIVLVGRYTGLLLLALVVYNAWVWPLPDWAQFMFAFLWIIGLLGLILFIFWVEAGVVMRVGVWGSWAILILSWLISFVIPHVGIGALLTPVTPQDGGSDDIAVTYVAEEAQCKSDLFLGESTAPVGTAKNQRATSDSVGLRMGTTDPEDALDTVFAANCGDPGVLDAHMQALNSWEFAPGVTAGSPNPWMGTFLSRNGDDKSIAHNTWMEWREGAWHTTAEYRNFAGMTNTLLLKLQNKGVMDGYTATVHWPSWGLSVEAIPRAHKVTNKDDDLPFLALVYLKKGQEPCSLSVYGINTQDKRPEFVKVTCKEAKKIVNKPTHSRHIVPTHTTTPTPDLIQVCRGDDIIRIRPEDRRSTDKAPFWDKKDKRWLCSKGPKPQPSGVESPTTNPVGTPSASPTPKDTPLPTTAPTATPSDKKDGNQADEGQEDQGSGGGDGTVSDG